MWKKIIADFQKFALRGNFIELAIGFTVGAAFTTIAKSFVDDIVMPPLGLLIGATDFADFYALLRSGPSQPGPYESLAAAEAAGAVTLRYGLFLNNLITFLLVAIAIFAVVRGVNKLDEKLEQRLGIDLIPSKKGEATKKCPHCLSTIPARATRCAHCTSPLDEPDVLL